MMLDNGPWHWLMTGSFLIMVFVSHFQYRVVCLWSLFWCWFFLLDQLNIWFLVDISLFSVCIDTANIDKFFMPLKKCVRSQMQIFGKLPGSGMSNMSMENSTCIESQSSIKKLQNLIKTKGKMRHLYSYQIPSVFFFFCCIEYNSKRATCISNYLMKFYVTLLMTKK